jgi:hypothetical protein
LRQHRQDDFVDTACRKLLIYALSRSLIISDEPLLEAIKSRLVADDYRVESLIQAIVSSPQFLNQRGSAYPR